ncbi:hypothetical protein VNI00_014106 [Paramarasmius palmivorus]|uniref:Uncharacterized protein n=1 Tax=Paramarasmius palmivorus TaxID=297713 RepID=A0AAW0BV15_9AGAR
MGKKERIKREKADKTPEPSLKNQYKDTLAQARANAAGNLYTFKDGVSSEVMYPRHNRTRLFAPKELFEAVDNEWVPHFHCPEGLIANYISISPDSDSAYAGKHIIACIRGPAKGCGYFIVVEEVYKCGPQVLLTQDYKEAHEQANMHRPKTHLTSPPTTPVRANLAERNRFDPDVKAAACEFFARDDMQVSPDLSVISYLPKGRSQENEESYVLEPEDTPTLESLEHVKIEGKPKRSRIDDDNCVPQAENISGLPVAKKAKLTKPLSPRRDEFVQGSSRDVLFGSTRETAIDLTEAD